MNWSQRCAIIPDGCSTASRMPCRHVQGVYPETIESARDAYIYSQPEDGSSEKGYVDYEMGLGSIILGHNNRRVREAVMNQLVRGTIYGVPSRLEGELAEVLHAIVPSAEMIRFTNTGSEACHAAIKIARAYTKRERIVHSGYHGWYSWYSAQSPQNLGCTEDEKRQIQTFPYNDLTALEKLFAEGPEIAAVIMEPYVLDAPASGFLRAVRELCDKHSTVLIFDEVVTGFRTPEWTAQKYFGVTPDLTCLGKSMSNGVVPISVVCGKKDLMMVLTAGCFVSGTFAANPLACSAALETIRVIEELGVIANIWEYGAQLKAQFDQAVNARSLAGITIRGYPCRTWFDFPTEEHKSLFWQECLGCGVWFGYAQFVSFAHTGTELDITAMAMNHGLDAIMKNWENPGAALKGKCAEATFRMVSAAPKSTQWRCLDPNCRLQGRPFPEAEYPLRGPQVPHCPRCKSKKIVEEKGGTV